MKKDNSVLTVKGFTLIELLIVMAIVALVFMSAITFAGALNERSNNSKRIADLRALQSIFQQYKADQGFYPCSLSADCPAGIALNLSASGTVPINSQVGNPNTPLNVVTYINAVPKDPILDTDHCYIYKAYKSKTDLVTVCNNTRDTTALPNDPINNCHFYQLMAVEESGIPNPLISPAVKCTGGGLDATLLVEPN